MLGMQENFSAYPLAEPLLLRQNDVLRVPSIRQSSSLHILNILASRNRDSGAVETYIPDTETAFDWLNYHS